MSSMLSLSMESRVLMVMSDTIKENVSKAVEECGKHYGFSVEEALIMLGIRNMEIKVNDNLKYQFIKNNYLFKIFI